MGAILPASGTKAEHLHTKNVFGTSIPNSWLDLNSRVSGGWQVCACVCVRETKLEALLGQSQVLSSHLFLHLSLTYI